MSSSLESQQEITKWFANMPAFQRNLTLTVMMVALLMIVGFVQSWNLAFTLLNMCLISAIMSLGFCRII